jgi:tetratricopeptide (TPR) repeat protein
LQLRTGNVDGATQSAQQAISLAEHVVQAGHSNWAATTQLASAYINLANAEVRGSSSQLASGHCKKAIDLLEPLAAAAPGDRDTQNRLATTYWRMGLVFVQLNNFEKATPYLEKALPLLEKLLAGDPSDAVGERSARWIGIDCVRS